jgi:hypothetical protein
MDLIYYFYRMTAGYNNFFKGLKWPVLLAVSLLANNVVAQVIVTPAPGPGFDYCVGGDFSAIGDIVITENQLFDFGADVSNEGNYTIQLPTGFEFNTSISPALSITGGDDLATVTNGGYNIAKTEYTFNFTLVENGSAGKDAIDQITISGLEVRSIDVGSGNLICSNTTNVIRTVGDNHCSLSSAVFTATLGSNDADNTFCEGTSVTFTVTPSIENAANTYNFQVDGITMQNSTSKIYTTTTLADGEEVTVIATYINGCTDTPAGITNTVIEYPVANIVSSEGSTICGGTEVEFTASPFPSGNYEFRVNTVQVQNGSSNSYITSSLNDGDDVDVIVTASPTAAACSDNSNVISMVVDDQPVADAGTGGSECDLDFQFSASLSTAGTGVWSKVSGPGNISFSTNANDPTATLTVDAYGSYVFRWTEVNGGCSDFDDLSVTFNEAPTADAGSGGDACSQSFLFSAVPSVGSGTWTQESGPGVTVFNNDNSPNATGTVNVYGTYVYRWTELNGVCSDFAEVTVNYYAPPTASITLGGGDVCGLSQNVTAVLSTGTGGTWSQVSGPGTVTFGVATALSTTATADAYGTYVVRWTEENNVCSDFDEVTINYYESPVSDAGSGGDACSQSFLFSAVPSVGSGTWTQESGPGVTVFNNDNSPNATGTVNVYGTYVYRWTELNGVCSDFAEVTVNYYAPPTASITLGGGDVCGLSQNVTAVLSTGTGGTWSQVSGPGTVTFGVATALSTTATADAYGTYVVRWTEENNVCSDFDEVTINYYESPVSDAGSGGDACSQSFLFSAVPSVGSGTWTQESGPGVTVFNNDNSPNATGTVNVYGTYVYRWTELNGVCSDFAEVTVNYYAPPTASITLGGGDVCGLSQNVTAALSTGTGGTWSQVSGPGTVTFGVATALSTTATADAYGTYVVRWTEENNACSDFDEVTINYYESPVSDAGSGGDACSQSFLFSAVPSVGSGTWTQESGPGVTVFNNDNSPNATGTVNVYGTYVYRWTELNGVCSDFAEVTVNYYAPPTASITLGGGDVCGLSQNVTAVLSTGTGGTWSQVSGPGTVTFGVATALSTTATADAYGTYVVRWTEENNVCSDFDEVTINYYESPVSDAGSGGDACSQSFLFSAVPSVGSGMWTQESGPGVTVFNNDNSPNATGTVNVYGTYVYRWTELNGVCSDFAEVTVNYYAPPTASITLGGGDVCGLSQNVTAALSTGTGGTWSQVSGPGTVTFAVATALSTTATADAYGTYVVRWTEENNVCSDFDEVTINYYESPVSDAGSGGDACSQSFLFSAVPSVGSGTWTQESGPGVTVFNNDNSPNATGTVNVYGTYVYRWTELNGVCSDFAEVTVNYYAPPTASITLGGGDVCGLSQNVTAVLSTGTGGTWSQVSGPGTVTFGVATALSTTATADAYGTYVVRWTEENNVCSDFDEVTINYYESPVSDAGSGGDACSQSFLFSAVPSVGSGTWTQESGPGVTVFNNDNSPNATGTVNVYGTYVYRWTELNGVCSDFAEVTVNYYAPPTASITLGGGDVCGLSQNVTAALSTGTGGTWSQVSGPGTVTFGAATALSTTATADAYGTYVVRWTEENNVCSDFDEVTINYYESPVSDAGSGGDACSQSFLFSAVPSVGSGTWTQESGPGVTVFNNDNSPNATGTVNVYGTYVYRWTELNGVCSDFAEVTVNYYAPPTASITLGGGDVCGLSQNVTAVLSTGTGGTWSQVSGPGTVTFGVATALSTTATADAYGTYVVRWTEENNACSDFDEVTINYYESPVSDAGSGGDACSQSFLFSAVPSVGSGTWTQESGPGVTVFNNDNSPNATGTVNVYGTYVYRWTELNGVCSDFAEVTVNYYAPPTASITLGGGDVCGLSQNVTAVLSTGTGGTWSQVSGPGTVTFGVATALSTTATADAYGTYVVRWTEENNVCSDFDEVTINYYESPVSDAGSGGDACSQSFLFSAVPSVGSGTWTQESGPGVTVFNNDNSPNATGTVNVYGTYVYRWTELNGVCSDFAEVTVNYYAPPTASITLGGGDVCGLSQNVTAALSTGTGGTWSQVSGPGTVTFGVATALSTTATADAYGTYVVRWTEENNACSDFDEVTINYYESPVSDAGSGGDACSQSFLFSAVPSVGSGTWTQESGPGVTVFNNDNSPNATGTVNVYGTYVYRWTELNGVCSDFAEVTVNYYAPPTASITLGGGDVCGLSQNVTAVLSTGTGGTWSQVSGPGTVTFGVATALSTTATADAYGTYVVRWTEENNVCSDFDEVTINYYESPVSDAGSGGDACSQSFLFSAVPSVGSGTWTQESGPGVTVFNNDNSPNATGTVNVYGTYVYRWTELNGVCSDFAEVTVNYYAPPTASITLGGGDVCGLSQNVTAVLSTGTGGTWSQVSGPGTVTFGVATALSTTATADAYGTYVVRWTEENNVCSDFDEVTINYYESPVSDAGSGGDACSQSFLFSAVPSVGSGTWTQESGPGVTVFNNDNSPNATGTVNVYGTYVYRWTELNGVCSDFAEVTVNYYAPPTASITLGGGDVCGLSQNVTAVLSTGTGGTWSQVSGPGTVTFGVATALSTTATADAYGTYVVRWTEENNACSDFDEVTINYYESPVSDAGSGGDACSQSFLFSAVPSVGSGTWTQESGPGVTVFNNDNSPNATGTVNVYGTYVYRWTELNGVCSDFAEVTVNYYAPPTASITLGGGDVCGLSQNVTAVLSTGTGGTWSQVSGPGTVTFGVATALSTTATADAYGTYVVRWTEENNVCSDFDEVTINYYESPVSDAGSGGDACSQSFLFSAVPSVGSGTWTQESGPGVTVFNNDNSPNATGTVNVYGTYVYRWTELNGVCSDFAEVTVNYYAPPTASITLGGGDVCGLSQNVTAALSTGTGGTWSQVSGPGTVTFGVATALSTTATADAYGTYVVRWTEENNVCSDFDEVTINYYESPVSDAGSGGDACSQSFLFSAVPSVGSGTWTQESGPGVTVFNNDNSPNATGTVNVYGTYVYRWTELNGVCSDFAEVTVNYYAPPTASITLGGGDVCGLSQNVTAVLSTGTGGTWSQVSGPGTVTFGVATALSTTATADAYGTYVVRWTEENNVCSDFDEVTINYYESPVSDAGSGGDACSQSFLFSAVPSVGSGMWTQESGPGVTVFNNDNSPNATGTVNVYGTYVYRWTELNGVCSDFAEVTVNYYAPPTASITLGGGDVCGLSQNVTAVLSTGTGGTWSQVSGSGTVTFAVATALSTTATADAYGTYVVRWTEENNACSDFDEVTINYYESPVSDAGSGGDACSQSFLFSAVPSVGSGMWTQESGPGVTVFNNDNSPNATGTVNVYGTYVYRWTELNGVCSDFAEVTVNYYAPPTASITLGGGDVCGLSQNVTAALSTGTGGTWSQVSGPGTVTFGVATALSTTATADAYGTYVVRWTEENNVCSDSDDVVVTFSNAVVLDPGAPAEVCSGISYTVTDASANHTNEILWTHDGSGALVDATTISPTYTPAVADAGNTVVLTLTATGNGACPDVIVTKDLAVTPSVIVDAGSNEEICEVTDVEQVFDFSLRSTQASSSNDNGTYNWVADPVVSGSFNDNTILNPTFEIVLGYNGTITFTLTAGGEGSCGDGVDSFVLLVRPTPSFSVTSHISNPTTINSGELTDIQISTTSGFVKLIQVIKSDNGLTGNSPINTLYQDGFTIQDVLENSTDIQQDIQYIFEAFDGSCTNPDKDTARVYVNPAPEFEVINTRPILCPSELTDITVDSETSGAVITLLDSIVSPNPNGITGMTPTGTSWSAVTSGLPFNITDGLVNSTDTIQTVRYIFEVNASGLTATKFTEVAVNPLPDFQLTLNDPFDSINSGTSTLILINTTTQNGVVVLDSIRKTGNILGNTTPGVTFVDGDQITDNLTNGTNSPQTITYYFSARANGCINAIDIDSAKVVVIPAPELVITNNQPEVCPINKTDIDLYSPTADAEVELTNITIIPDATGVSNFSPIGTIWAGGPTELVAKIADSLINSSDVIQTITYDLRISANGFTATTNKTVSVEIRPNPQMSLSNNNPNILSNTSTDIFINTPTENGQVELSAIDKDEDILGNTSAGVAFTDGNRINDVLVNNSDTILSISYIFRATANTCINPDTDTVSVTVNPIPNFTITNALPILCPEQKSDFEVTSPTANAEISLTAVQIAPNPSGVTGFTTPATWTGDGSGLVLEFKDLLENLTDTIQTVTYEFDIEANGFDGTETKTVSVEVNPLPRQVITNNQPVVNVDTKTDILINTTTENGGALLLDVIKDAGIVGNTTSGVVFSDSDRIEDELVNQTDNVLTIKYVFKATANGCENSETDMAIVEVNPNPRLTIANNKPIICSGETVDIQISSPTAGATIRLVSATAVPDAGSVVGLTPDNFTWNTFPATISDELSQTTNVIQRVEYLFEVSVPGYANPVLQSAVVDVKPLPDISASGPEICSGGVTSVDIGNPNSVSFTVFNWTVCDANGNIEGEAPGTGNRITQVLDNTTVLLDSVIYRIYATAQLCAGDSIDVVQRVYPQNVAIAGTDTVVCQGTPAITIETANIAGGSTAASWSKITGGGTLTDETTLTPTYAPDPIDEVGTITLELTASNASVCPPVTDLVSIIINSKPTVEAGSNQTICEGSTALMSEAMIGGSAASVTWSDPSGKGSFLPNNATLNAIFEPHPDQVGTNVKLYVETNDPSGPCVSAIDSLYITINDAPEVSAGADQTICEGDVAVMSDATIGGGTSSVTWSGGAGTWDDVHKLDATYTPDASEIGEVVILTITTDDPDGPCTAISDQIRVAVNKAPEVYAGTDQIVCEGETVLIGDATSGGSTTSVLWTGGTGTFSPNNTTLNTTYIHAAGEVNSTVTLTITTNDPDGPCVAVSDQIDITINDAPEVFAGADQTICEGDVAVMSEATIGGGTSSITWSGGSGTWDDVHKLDATYTPDASEIGSVVILTITTDDPAGPCTAISDQIRVAVNKAPEVFAGVDKVICEGDQVLINDATSGGSTTSVLWTGGTGEFSPNNTTLNTTYIHAAGEVNSTVTLTITTNDPDGPCVAVSDQIDITINDAPEVFAGADQTICEGDVAVMSDATYGGGTSSITWSGGAGTWDDVHKLDATYTPDASEIGSVVILTITTDDPDGPCTAISDQIRVAVNKAPEVFSGVDKVICEGDQVLINDATSGGSTTSVLWTGGTGTFSPNNTTLNTTYIHAAGEVNSTVTLTITTNDPDGPCVAVSDQIDITINDAPEVFAGADQTICEGDVAVMSDATYGGGTSSITWSGGSGTWDDVHKLDATYTPDASEIGSVVILTITTDDPDGPCAAISDQIRVAVNKAPEVFAGVDKVICEGEQVLISDATSGGSTTSVLWTGGTGTFSPNNTTLNTTYIHAVGEVNSTVTLTITTNDPDGPCVAVTDEVNITIDEAPTVDAGVYAPVCIGDAVQLNGLLGGSASSATWTGGVGEFDPDRNSTNARYIADESEQGGRVLLTLTTNDPDGVCVASSATTEIVVNRLPSPKIFFLKDAYQIDDAPETLVGEPSPGIFDGSGMFESTFIPAVADIGVHTITYTHTDGNGCTNFVSQETEVFPLPESEVGNPDPYCLGVNPTDFPLPRTSNTDELEDSWFGDNVFQAGDDYYFNNVAAGVGLHAIDYIVVNRSTGARDTLPRSATVYDVAKVNFTNINKCIADSIQFVDLSVLEDADVFGDEIESWIWEFGKGSNLRVSEEQNPKILFDENEPDNYFVKLEVVTKLGQCASDFAKDTIKVGAIPDADFFVSNLTSGELAQFSDATGVPNPRYISGSFIDPTTSIDSIWWDFGEPPAQFGAHQIYKNVEHRFSEPKEYNVKMVVKTNLGCRDTVTRSISILQVISTFPHITDFDTPPINDQAHRPDTSSWRLMVPDGNIIKGTSRAWVTSDEVTGRHKDSEHSFVALDAYDLRSLVRPMFTMDVWSNAESTRDGAMLQYSFNGNQWFTMIDEQAVEKVDYPAGQIGLNWYNEKGLVSRPGDGTIEGISGVGENEFAAGWTGIYDSWRTARFPLDDIRTELIEDNHISVRFRVVFASDEQNPEGTDYDGFAFDNIIVSDRSHNVLIEHFDNLSSGNQINLMNETAERFSLDMIALQYHTNYPQADVIYLNNKFPVETRGSIYDISQSPRAFMDGISEYNFTSATIEKYQIVNRSMIDPVFDIQLTPEKIAPNTVTMDVIITAQTAFDEEVTLYTMPIETSITRLDELNDFNIDSLNNIVKDLLPSGGLLIDQTWEVNDTYSTQLVWDLNQLNEGNEIYDTTKLGVIVFVQNAANEGSREIYQAIFEKLPVIQPTPITGLDDDLNARRIAEAEIYPNPADQHFNVALSGKLTSDVAWVIVDQRGIELQNGVFYKGEDLYQVDAAALPAGLHMMIFSSSEDHRVIRKIIINR